MCYADVFMILLLVGGALCFVAYGIDQSDPTNLYLGVVLVLVVVLSGERAGPGGAGWWCRRGSAACLCGGAGG